MEIKRVEGNLEKGQLDVFSLETHPPPKSIVIQALTQPYHIVKLKKVDIPVMFIPGS
ncbi:MAG: protease complex subunit PrcB family protein [Thermodesulfobacteriota bacterium]